MNNDIFLAIDIGNTTIQCGIYDDDKLLTSWRLSSEVARTPDECWLLTEFFCDKAGLGSRRPKAVAVSSVVPNHTRSFTHMTRDHYSPDPLVISVDSCPFLDVRYSNPRQVGADRLCNAFAGYYHFGGPLIVLDFGTAITFDTIDANGSYLGGVIFPGPKTAARSLHSSTARLPQVSLVFPKVLIAQSTDAAIQAGLTWGTVDMIDGMVERISRELNAKPKVIATGGYAEPYVNRSKTVSTVYDNLVLEGVRLIFNKARELK